MVKASSQYDSMPAMWGIKRTCVYIGIDLGSILETAVLCGDQGLTVDPSTMYMADCVLLRALYKTTPHLQEQVHHVYIHYWGHA